MFDVNAIRSFIFWGGAYLVSGGEGEVFDVSSTGLLLW